MPTRPVVVAVNGSAADLPTLAWAAEEASSTDRPLLITHGVGHLPPAMTYAERHVARRQRQEQGAEVVGRAAQWVHDQAANVPLETMVRLLDSAALLPAISRSAHTVTQTGDGWTGSGSRGGRSPVIAVADGTADELVLDFASGYADRRGVELVVVDGHGPGVARRLLERRPTGSLLLLPQPERRCAPERISWPMVTDIFARSRSPVALVGQTTEASNQPAPHLPRTGLNILTSWNRPITRIGTPTHRGCVSRSC